MKWQKLGKIFTPTDYRFPNNCHEFAQSPQALVLDDRIRIYFSIREKDASGKYLSHIAFVDYDKTMQHVLKTSDHQVIPLGALGTFDEHGIFPINPVRDGNRILAYTTGWNRRVSVSVDTSIGLAISHDNGHSFQKLGNGPVMTASLREPFLVADAFVSIINNTYHMWYIYGSHWKKFDEHSQPDRVYKIAYAHSPDGINWQRDGVAIIPDRIDADECQALPTIFHRNNKFHMYFCYRHAFGFRHQSSHAYRIGYAWSDDMKHWHRDDDLAGIDISPDGWDAQMQCYPHVFEVEGTIYMLYNGNEFGRYGFGLAKLEDCDN